MNTKSDTPLPARTICGVRYQMGACPSHVVASVQMSPLPFDHPSFWRRLAEASYDVAMLGHKPVAVWFELDLTGWWWIHIETARIPSETLNRKDVPRLRVASWLRFRNLMRQKVAEDLKTPTNIESK